MPVTADAKHAPGVIRFTFDDPWPSTGDFDRLRSQLIAAGQFTPDSAVMYDLRQLHRLPRLTSAEVERCSARPSPLLARRRAYLATTPLQFGFAGRLQSLGPQDLLSEIFSVEADALRWLSE